MSYLCGLGSGMGVPAREPALLCDACGVQRPVTNRHGVPAAWFLDRKKAPGWTMHILGENRRDFCPKCKHSGRARTISYLVATEKRRG